LRGLRYFHAGHLSAKAKAEAQRSKCHIIHCASVLICISNPTSKKSKELKLRRHLNLKALKLQLPLPVDIREFAVSLAPLLNAVPQIPVHAFAAMTAFVLGIVQFAAPKGTLPHRTLGWIWVALMATVAVSSFWIHQIRLIGPWSPIHLLSIFTLVMLPLAVWKAHRHAVADHRRIMILLFTGALVIAGLFTLLPGRIMHAVVFGD
jgi:uncharacterized membrane protein